MRRISLRTAKPGMILARAIPGSSGQVLLQPGIELKPQYLAYLERLGIAHLYVRDERLSLADIDDIVSEKTRRATRALVKGIIGEIKSPAFQKKGILINDRAMVKAVSNLIGELLDKKEIMIQLTDMRTTDDYLFAHSVNSAIISAAVALKMNYGKKALECLALGTLLHDMGMVYVPVYIINKPGPLSEDEEAAIRRHPIDGLETFKKFSCYSSRAGDIILQHHERFEGQGYPQGLKGGTINPLAQIAGLVDVYDALISDRPYRKALLPHQAVEMLMSLGGSLFDVAVLNHFFSIVAAYPVGFQVQLSNGEGGFVIANNPGFTLCPKIKVLFTGRDMAPHPAPYDINLALAPDITITEVIN